jgi:hypothetical protein
MNLDLRKEQQAYEKLAASVLEGNKSVLFDALKKADIDAVVVEFDGEGDSDQITGIAGWSGGHLGLPEEVQIEMALVEWGATEPTRKTLPIREAVEEISYGLLEKTHGGWEIDDGAYGEFLFDVPNRKITLTFNARITDVRTSVHAF